MNDLNLFITESLLILIGHGIVGGLQIMDLLGKKECPPIAQYPIHSFFRTGNILKGRPVVCGGLDDHTGFISACYRHDPETNFWSYFTSLHTARALPASAIVEDKLWVIGGGAGIYGNGIKSTEFIYPNGKSVPGPNLPAPRIGPCLINLLDGRYLVAGGGRLGSDALDSHTDVWIYDSRNGSFMNGPPIIRGTMNPACTLFYSPLHDNRPVAMVIIETNDQVPIHVEVLDFTRRSAVWENCKYFLSYQPDHFDSKSKIKQHIL